MFLLFGIYIFLEFLGSGQVLRNIPLENRILNSGVKSVFRELVIFGNFLIS